METKNPEFKARFGPRGVMKCIATGGRGIPRRFAQLHRSGA
jgi:hypothetical protein